MLHLIIVNYRTPALVIDCLRSLDAERMQAPGMTVCVADSPSGDDSVARISAAIDANGWGGWVELMSLPRNGGFAYGNNAAIRARLADRSIEYFMLLNPDTIVRPGAIAALLRFMKEAPRAGIAGSRLESPDGSRHNAAFRFHTVGTEFISGCRLGILDRLFPRWVIAGGDAPVRADWVSGAAFMIRRAVIEQCGPLDESFFMYYEETDLCLRADRAGWEVWHVPQSRIVHLEGQCSSAEGAGTPARRSAWWYESRRRYFVKNHGRLYATLADIAWSLGYFSWRVRCVVQRKPRVESSSPFRDFFIHSTLTWKRSGSRAVR